MKCSRCGEDITAPYFFEGKPFGYTCIKIVNPFAKKKKKGAKEHWVVAESHDFNPGIGKQQVTAMYDGRKHKEWVFLTVRGNDTIPTHSFFTPHFQIGVDNTIYINIAAFNYYWKPDYKAPCI